MTSSVHTICKKTKKLNSLDELNLKAQLCEFYCERTSHTYKIRGPQSYGEKEKKKYGQNEFQFGLSRNGLGRIEIITQEVTIIHQRGKRSKNEKVYSFQGIPIVTLYSY